jgi:hypothetical protein
LFGDVWAEDSAPVDLDRRVDDFREINSITPSFSKSFLILQAAGNFLNFFALFDRRVLPPQISCLSLARAPVAQLDRASDYGSEG